ncbi:hypothetical protein OSH08_00005, partial [Kaistia geumhonensis]|uniref:hypothetical protein n=1 Tax=Kaistia geumhonensis TaxID=410839 RepID=UPI00224CB1A7
QAPPKCQHGSFEKGETAERHAPATVENLCRMVKKSEGFRRFGAIHRWFRASHHSRGRESA